MILYHYSSLNELLRCVYPEFKWDESRFRRPKVQATKKYWEDISRQRDLLDSIGKDLNLKQVSSLLAPLQELILFSICTSYQIGTVYHERMLRGREERFYSSFTAPYTKH